MHHPSPSSFNRPPAASGDASGGAPPRPPAPSPSPSLAGSGPGSGSGRPPMRPPLVPPQMFAQPFMYPSPFHPFPMMASTTAAVGAAPTLRPPATATAPAMRPPTATTASMRPLPATFVTFGRPSFRAIRLPTMLRSPPPPPRKPPSNKASSKASTKASSKPRAAGRGRGSATHRPPSRPAMDRPQPKRPPPRRQQEADVGDTSSRESSPLHLSGQLQRPRGRDPNGRSFRTSHPPARLIKDRAAEDEPMGEGKRQRQGGDGQSDGGGGHSSQDGAGGGGAGSGSASDESYSVAAGGKRKATRGKGGVGGSKSKRDNDQDQNQSNGVRVSSDSPVWKRRKGLLPPFLPLSDGKGVVYRAEGEVGDGLAWQYSMRTPDGNLTRLVSNFCVRDEAGQFAPIESLDDAEQKGKLWLYAHLVPFNYTKPDNQQQQQQQQEGGVAATATRDIGVEGEIGGEKDKDKPGQREQAEGGGDDHNKGKDGDGGGGAGAGQPPTSPPLMPWIPVKARIADWCIDYGLSWKDEPSLWLVSDSDTWYRIDSGLVHPDYGPTFQSAKLKFAVVTRIVKALLHRPNVTYRHLVGKLTTPAPIHHQQPSQSSSSGGQADPNMTGWGEPLYVSGLQSEEDIYEMSDFLHSQLKDIEAPIPTQESGKPAGPDGNDAPPADAGATMAATLAGTAFAQTLHTRSEKWVTKGRKRATATTSGKAAATTSTSGSARRVRRMPGKEEGDELEISLNDRQSFPMALKLPVKIYPHTPLIGIWEFCRTFRGMLDFQLNAFIPDPSREPTSATSPPPPQALILSPPSHPPLSLQDFQTALVDTPLPPHAPAAGVSTPGVTKDTPIDVMLVAHLRPPLLDQLACRLLNLYLWSISPQEDAAAAEGRSKEGGGKVNKAAADKERREKRKTTSLASGAIPPFLRISQAPIRSWMLSRELLQRQQEKGADSTINTGPLHTFTKRLLSHWFFARADGWQHWLSELTWPAVLQGVLFDAMYTPRAVGGGGGGADRGKRERSDDPDGDVMMEEETNSIDEQQEGEREREREREREGDETATAAVRETRAVGGLKEEGDREYHFEFDEDKAISKGLDPPQRYHNILVKLNCGGYSSLSVVDRLLTFQWLLDEVACGSPSLPLYKDYLRLRTDLQLDIQKLIFPKQQRDRDKKDKDKDTTAAAAGGGGADKGGDTNQPAASDAPSQPPTPSPQLQRATSTPQASPSVNRGSQSAKRGKPAGTTKRGRAKAKPKAGRGRSRSSLLDESPVAMETDTSPKTSEAQPNGVLSDQATLTIPPPPESLLTPPPPPHQDTRDEDDIIPPPKAPSGHMKRADLLAALGEEGERVIGQIAGGSMAEEAWNGVGSRHGWIPFLDLSKGKAKKGEADKDKEKDNIEEAPTEDHPVLRVLSHAPDLAVRAEPIGQDRYLNRYFYFGAEMGCSRVWVELDRPSGTEWRRDDMQDTDALIRILRKKLMPNSTEDDTTATTTTTEQQPTSRSPSPSSKEPVGRLGQRGRIFDSRRGISSAVRDGERERFVRGPLGAHEGGESASASEAYGGCWGYIDLDEDGGMGRLQQLIASLSSVTKRESALKKALTTVQEATLQRRKRPPSHPPSHTHSSATADVPTPRPPEDNNGKEKANGVADSTHTPEPIAPLATRRVGHHRHRDHVEAARPWWVLRVMAVVHHLLEVEKLVLVPMCYDLWREAADALDNQREEKKTMDEAVRQFLDEWLQPIRDMCEWVARWPVYEQQGITPQQVMAPTRTCLVYLNNLFDTHPYLSSLRSTHRTAASTPTSPWPPFRPQAWLQLLNDTSRLILADAPSRRVEEGVGEASEGWEALDHVGVIASAWHTLALDDVKLRNLINVTDRTGYQHCRETALLFPLPTLSLAAAPFVEIPTEDTRVFYFRSGHAMQITHFTHKHYHRRSHAHHAPPYPIEHSVPHHSGHIEEAEVVKVFYHPGVTGLVPRARGEEDSETERLAALFGAQYGHSRTPFEGLMSLRARLASLQPLESEDAGKPASQPIPYVRIWLRFNPRSHPSQADAVASSLSSLSQPLTLPPHTEETPAQSPSPSPSQPQPQPSVPSSCPSPSPDNVIPPPPPQEGRRRAYKPRGLPDRLESGLSSLANASSDSLMVDADGRRRSKRRSTMTDRMLHHRMAIMDHSESPTHHTERERERLPPSRRSTRGQLVLASAGDDIEDGDAVMEDASEREVVNHATAMADTSSPSQQPQDTMMLIDQPPPPVKSEVTSEAPDPSPESVQLQMAVSGAARHHPHPCVKVDVKKEETDTEMMMAPPAVKQESAMVEEDNEKGVGVERGKRKRRGPYGACGGVGGPGSSVRGVSGPVCEGPQMSESRYAMVCVPLHSHMPDFIVPRKRVLKALSKGCMPGRRFRMAWKNLHGQPIVYGGTVRKVDLSGDLWESVVVEWDPSANDKVPTTHGGGRGRKKKHPPAPQPPLQTQATDQAAAAVADGQPTTTTLTREKTDTSLGGGGGHAVVGEEGRVNLWEIELDGAADDGAADETSSGAVVAG